MSLPQQLFCLPPLTFVSPSNYYQPLPPFASPSPPSQPPPPLYHHLFSPQSAPPLYPPPPPFVCPLPPPSLSNISPWSEFFDLCQPLPPFVSFLPHLSAPSPLLAPFVLCQSTLSDHSPFFLAPTSFVSPLPPSYTLDLSCECRLLLHYNAH